MRIALLEFGLLPLHDRGGRLNLQIGRRKRRSLRHRLQLFQPVQAPVERVVRAVQVGTQRFGIHGATQRRVEHRRAGEFVERLHHLFSAGRLLAAQRSAQLVGDERTVGELLQRFLVAGFANRAFLHVFAGSVPIHRVGAGLGRDVHQRVPGHLFHGGPSLGPRGIRGGGRLVGGGEEVRYELLQLARRLLAARHLFRGRRGQLQNIHRHHVQNRQNLLRSRLGVAVDFLQVARHQLRPHLQDLGRLVGSVVGGDVVVPPVVLVIRFGVLLCPGVQVLEQRRRVGLIFQGLVVDVVFALVLDLLLGRGRRRWGLRPGELSSSSENDGAHYGDGRDSVVGPIHDMQRVPPACFSLLN